ncbi:SCO family protein [Bacillus dakarensis]|uniref:SCO family protein n=1 Tax=Robertmurraya dakarensis TaxID=1926278 RepID=UPI00098187EF|nr:SCO family protein [Bacillus dakarensis]
MRVRLGLLSLLILVLLTGCGQSGIPDAKNWQIEDFTFTNHEGEPFGLKDLKGKIWIADFIFTNCDDVCLPMTSNMVKLQMLAKEEGIENVEFVSISIDPKVDTPETLKKFGEQFNVDFSNFHFLTGYDQEFIEQFAVDNFKTFVKKPEGQDQVIHGTDFFLIDQEGKIMTFYTGLNDIPFDEIIKDMKALQ